jgi:toxin YhaV
MAAPLRVNGWTILLHPLFLEQVAALVSETQRARSRDPGGYQNRNAAKRLAAVLKLAFHAIPQDPTSRVYLQGGTLGTQHKHWLRAKFFRQYRLFFRCDRGSRVIVYGWVNDEATKRAYGSSSDAYRVFSAMLAKGTHPTTGTP